MNMFFDVLVCLHMLSFIIINHESLYSWGNGFHVII